MTEAPAFPPVVSTDVDEIEYVDYFTFDETYTFALPDGKQHIYFKAMTEGMRARYQKLTNRDIHFNRINQDARLSVDPATDRQALVSVSVTGWDLKRKNPRTGRWEDAPFSNNGTPGDELHKWMDVVNPKILDALEEAIRAANPWLLQDMTVEQVDREMERLVDLRKQLVEKEAKEATFS